MELELEWNGTGTGMEYSRRLNAGCMRAVLVVRNRAITGQYPWVYTALMSPRFHDAESISRSQVPTRAVLMPQKSFPHTFCILRQELHDRRKEGQSPAMAGQIWDHHNACFNL